MSCGFSAARSFKSVDEWRSFLSYAKTSAMFLRELRVGLSGGLGRFGSILARVNFSREGSARTGSLAHVRDAFNALDFKNLLLDGARSCSCESAIHGFHRRLAADFNLAVDLMA